MRSMRMMKRKAKLPQDFIMLNTADVGALASGSQRYFSSDLPKDETIPTGRSGDGAQAINKH